MLVSSANDDLSFHYGFSAPARASVPRGFYSTPFDVQLTLKTTKKAITGGMFGGNAANVVKYWFTLNGR